MLGIVTYGVIKEAQVLCTGLDVLVGAQAEGGTRISSCQSKEMGADGIVGYEYTCLTLGWWWRLSDASIGVCVCACMCAREPALPNICMWLAWLKQVPGPPRGIAPHLIILQTCAHRYEARQRVDQILETRDVIGRCFVLSQDLAIHDELDGGEWKFCEGRPQGHEQFGFCQQGAAAAFSPDSHYLLFGAPGTYNWKGESLISQRGKGDQIVFLPQRGDFWQHAAKHAHIFTAI